MNSTEPSLRVLDEITAACLQEQRRQLTEWETYKVLGQWSIPVAPCELVTSAEGAAYAARSLGGKVAVKIVSPDIPHKTDAGCVRLGLAGEEAVSQAFLDVMTAAMRHKQNARIHGVLVQKMVPPGVELIAGGVVDGSFGPVLAAGVGGIFTEVMKDAAFRLAPITEAEAGAMLTELKGYPLLTGARGRPPVDLAAVRRTLAQLSRLISAWPALKEIDLNPLIAGPTGVVAVDGLVTLRD